MTESTQSILDGKTHLTFDCYGTLIDWERGILDVLRPFGARHGVERADAAWLGLYAEAEAAVEAGPYRRYREVLREVMERIAAELGCGLALSERDLLADSVIEWRPFPDTTAALRRLKTRFELAILSNVDDAMIRRTIERLAVDFDEVITAEQARSYKPSPNNFRLALERLAIPKSRLVHVAQSLFHDHAPAKALGLTTVWINRPSAAPGTGVAPPSDAVPDFEFPDLQSFAAAAVEG
jgi:2-haloacid dehalogenase